MSKNDNGGQIWKKDLERGMMIGTGFMVINLFIGFLATIALAIPMTGVVSNGGAFLEMGIFLMLGGCLMSRQPLKNEARYDENGAPASTWKLAIIGRQMIFAGVFLFLYAAIIAIISLYISI
ncbi:MAG: hypothetical protein E4H14_02010 [Candidatus Thorarchaeota archaeon]|nr:MAG: hypothetical protein E4H14_02010 [Candidatus Thorarchaeota archaeon]